MITVKIRPIAMEDVAAIEEHISFDWAALRKHRERLEEQEGGEALYLVAWIGDLPVGHLLVKWQGSTDEPVASVLNDCPDIEDLFVSPEYRFNRIGTRLLETAEQLAVDKGYARVGLGVSVDNPRARSLYERLGYRDAGFEEYETGGAYVDRDGTEMTWKEVCVYMTKQLK